MIQKIHSGSANVSSGLLATSVIDRYRFVLVERSGLEAQVHSPILLQQIGRCLLPLDQGRRTTQASFRSVPFSSSFNASRSDHLQATLELTLLFSNVHDVLYSNPGNSMRSHLAGGYIKYIDDFRSAIYGWRSVWGTLTCSPQLKATLLMSYDYLRLYTNAFAFHATVKRALPQIQQESRKSNSTAPGRVFYNNVGAVGDARFIYEGLDAAKSLLSMVNTFVDPEKSLRYMPLRFYLYSIYSGVFLYRARCVGVLASDEEQAVRNMVKETVNRLVRILSSNAIFKQLTLLRNDPGSAHNIPVVGMPSS